jgi:predicted MarR family transcription regulator
VSQQLSAFEFAFIVLMYGFNRWVETCMAVAQVPGLAALNILVLHAVNHRSRGKRLSEICTMLNIDESIWSLMLSRSYSRPNWSRSSIAAASGIL